MFQVLLIFLYPLGFLLGKVVARLAEEEIYEVRGVVRFITQVLILSVVFLILNFFVSIWASLFVSFMLLFYLVSSDESHKEKVILSMVAGFGIVHFLEEVLMLSLIAVFLKGLTLHREGDLVLSHRTGLEVSLFFLLLFFKFIIINVF